MKKYSVIYSDEAIADLDDIYCYIAFHLKERKTVWDLTVRIRKSIRDLSTQAEMSSISSARATTDNRGTE